MAKGRKTGGRQKGTPNKAPSVLQMLETLNSKPAEFLSFVMDHKLRCQHCTTENRKECTSCNGTGLQKIEVGQRITAATVLLDRIAPKLQNKTLDVTMRRTMLARMNSMTERQKREVEERVGQDVEGGIVDE